MKHRQGTIGILVDPYGALHVMEAVAIWGDLQMPPLIPHRVVVGDDALLLEAENLGEVRPNPGDEGGAGFRRRYRKASVVGRKKLLGEIPVGRCHRGDLGQGQLFGQPILEGAEDALGAAPRLRRIGGNQRDSQLLQRAMDRGEAALVHLAPGRFGVPVVGPSIRIQRAEEPLRLNDVPQPLETAHRACFVDEAGRIEVTRGILHRHHEIPPTAGDPLMGRAVLMQHHARQRFAEPLLAMRPTPGSSRHMSCGVQPGLRPRIGARPAMLVERLHRPARVAALVQQHHLQRFIHRDRPS